jgi:hypothetical protein
MDDEVTVIFWTELDIDINFPVRVLWLSLISIAQSYQRRQKR